MQVPKERLKVTKENEAQPTRDLTGFYLFCAGLVIDSDLAAGPCPFVWRPVEGELTTRMQQESATRVEWLQGIIDALPSLARAHARWPGPR